MPSSVVVGTAGHIDHGKSALVRALTGVDPDRLELARLDVRELVAGSFLQDAPVVPVSSPTGTGLDDVRAALIEAAAHVRQRAAGGVVRLPVDRAFSMKGFGPVVTGTLTSG